MKRSIETILTLLFVTLLAAYSSTAAEANDRPALPTSPQDRVAPTDPTSKSVDQAQAITVRVAGVHLRDSQGAPLGRVEDLVVDPNTGKIEFLIVSAFFPTNSTKLTPVPWKAIKHAPEESGLGTVPGANQVFALSFPRSKLQQAPTFERFRWPDMTQSAWRDPIYKYYSGKASADTGAVGDESQVGVGNASSIETGTALPNNSAGSQTNGSQRLPAVGVPGPNTLNDPLRSRTSTSTNALPIGRRL